MGSFPVPRLVLGTALFVQRAHISEHSKLNTQKIRILLAAIDKGSLTKAGQALGYTQSYLTQIMKAFEDEVGFPLLVKTNRGVEPTQEARTLIPAMRRIIESEEQFDQEVGGAAGTAQGHSQDRDLCQYFGVLGTADHRILSEQLSSGRLSDRRTWSRRNDRRTR